MHTLYKRICLPIFKPGMIVNYRGQNHIINNTLITNGKLMVWLVGEERPIDAEKIQCFPRIFEFFVKPNSTN